MKVRRRLWPRRLLAPLLLFLAVTLQTGCGTEPAPTKQYRFTTDWMTVNIANWEKHLAPFKGKPDLAYLEVGLFEGRSALWMLDNILTHPTATATGIDIFSGDLEERFHYNLEQSGFSDKVKVMVGYSQRELKKLHRDSFDIIYVDGAHRAEDVLADAVLSWDLLKVGGVIIFDDYLWRRNELPRGLVPKTAIDGFVDAYANYLQVIHRGKQLFLKRRASPCGEFFRCTPLAPYIFVWDFEGENFLYDPRREARVKLSPEEQPLMLNLARSRRFGRTHLEPGPKLAGDPAFHELSQRLGLRFDDPETKRPRSQDPAAASPGPS